MAAPDPPATPLDTPPPTTPALDYAPRPGGRRRWGRRLRRWWPAWAVLALAGLGVAYGPRTWRHFRLMRLQEACMAAEMPADRPVFEDDPAEVAALVAAWPAEYRLEPTDGSVARVDPRWTALSAALSLPAGPGARGIVLCHERYTPGGGRRLVVVEGWRLVRVFRPAEWLGGHGPVMLGCRMAEVDDASRDSFIAALLPTGASRTAAGITDPADRSRWTATFVRNGVPGTWEYRLLDDDTVTMRLLDPPGFRSRAEAARAAEVAAGTAADGAERSPTPGGEPGGPLGR